MTHESLLGFYENVSNVAHNPNSTASERLRARKEAILAELESAHIGIYHSRAKKAIKDEIAARKARDKMLKDDKKNPYCREDNHDIRYNNLEHIHENNNNNNLENYPGVSKEYKFKSLFFKEDPLDPVISKQAFAVAEAAVQQDERLARFRQRVDELEAKGKTKDLESILAAAHNVSAVDSGSAQNFLDAFEAVPEEDKVAFSTATANLFVEPVYMFAESPLLSKLRAITPNSKKKGIDLPEIYGEPESYLSALCKEKTWIKEINEKGKYNRIEKNREKDIGFFSGLKRRDTEEMPEILGDYESSSMKHKLLQGLQRGVYGTSGDYIGDARFFSEVREIYSALGREVGSNWLRHLNAFFAEDQDKGKNFAIESRLTLTDYCTNLGWDLETFVRDYRSLGKMMFEVHAVNSKFAAFNDKRRKALVRYLIDNEDDKSKITITKLKRCPLPRPGLLEKLLPEEMPIQEVVASIKETSRLYDICIAGKVNEKLVTRKLERVQRVENLEGYTKVLHDIEEQVKEFIDFAEEQRKDLNMNLGFDEAEAQEVLGIYEEVLGRSFAQFKRDFTATGTDFQKLPDIGKAYVKYLGAERTRAFLNYVTKQRNRDLINDLASPAPKELIVTSLDKLGDAGKEDTVKAIRELNRTWSFLNDIGAGSILTERLNSLASSSGGEAVINAISGSRSQCYSAVTGGAEVPKGLEQMVDNTVIAYYKNTGTHYDVEIKPAINFIVSTYLQKGAEAAFRAIGELEPNKKLKEQLKREGVDLDLYKTGISKTYHVSTDEGSLNRVKERIDAEVEQVWDRLEQLYAPKDDEKEDDEIRAEQEQIDEQIKKLKQGSLREQLDGVEKFIGAYKFDDETKPLKLDIKGHIQTARSLTGTLKEMDADATFYVSRDPLESLHMGQYFGSCLSLSKSHGGCNGWASVVQTMDANKNVIYAKTEEGKYVGRNRTALTDRGTLCTRFYQNGDMNLNHAWINYLGEFADHTKQDVMIPISFCAGSMSQILEKMVANGEALKEDRTVKIAPAYYNAFYGDGLSTMQSSDNSIQIKAEVYVIKPRGGN